MTHIPGHDPPSSTRGDDPAAAGRSLRAIAKLQKRLTRRARVHLLGSAVGALAAITASLLLLTLPTGQAVVAAYALTVSVTVLVAALLYPARALAVASALTATALAFLASRHLDVPPLLQVTGGVLIVVAGLVIHSTRRTRRNAAGPTVIAQFSVPAAVVVVDVSGVPMPTWLILAGATTVACWAWRSEVVVTVAAWRAALRSRIRYVAGYPNPSRQRESSKWMNPEYLERGAAAEAATAELLATLGPRWYVLHSRALHNTAADADHIVIGPPGVLLLDTKYRTGAFECTPWVAGEQTGAEWTFNGRPIPADVVESAVYEAERIAWAFGAGNAAGQPVPTVLVIHGARMNVPWGDVTFDLTAEDPDTGDDRVFGTRTVTLVDAEHVVDYLRQLPARRFADPNRTERRLARMSGKSEEVLVAEAQDRYIGDLATVAEHLFVPTG